MGHCSPKLSSSYVQLLLLFINHWIRKTDLHVELFYIIFHFNRLDSDAVYWVKNQVDELNQHLKIIGEDPDLTQRLHENEPVKNDCSPQISSKDLPLIGHDPSEVFVLSEFVNNKLVRHFFHMNQAYIKELNPSNCFEYKHRKKSIIWYQSVLPSLFSGHWFMFNAYITPTYLFGRIADVADYIDSSKGVYE